MQTQQTLDIQTQYHFFRFYKYKIVSNLKTAQVQFFEETGCVSKIKLHKNILESIQSKLKPSYLLMQI